jgi:hypothetical protein
MRQIVAAWRKTFCLSSVGKAAKRGKGVGVEGVISMIQRSCSAAWPSRQLYFDLPLPEE